MHVKNLVGSVTTDGLLYTVSGFYDKYSKFESVDSKNDEQYMNLLTEMFSCVHKYIVLTGDLDLEFIFNLGMTDIQLQESIQSVYRSIKQGDLSIHHLKVFCNLILNVMDKIFKGCLDMTKNLLGVNIKEMHKELTKQ